MSKIKILVTDGAGYIGCHAVLALQTAGYEVVVLDNLVYGHRRIVDEVLKVELIVGDTSDRPLLDRIFSAYDIAAVMHFAAYTYVGESVTNPAKYYKNNVLGTFNLLEAMLEANVKYFVFSSTCATYGEPERIPIPEDHPQNPINSYGMGKLMVEKMLADFDLAYNFKSVCFRYFNAAGADPEARMGEDHNPETHLIPLILQTALGQREHISVFGTDYPTPDGTCIRDYIHVTDLAQAHALGLAYLLNGGETTAFNLGNGNGYSVREVIDMAQQVTQKPIKVVLSDRRSGDTPILVGSSDRAKKLLGWQPQYASLSQIMQHAWNWANKRSPSEGETQNSENIAR
jgi:UDP-glucose 4-epimerase